MRSKALGLKEIQVIHIWDWKLLASHTHVRDWKPLYIFAYGASMFIWLKPLYINSHMGLVYSCMIGSPCRHSHRGASIFTYGIESPRMYSQMGLKASFAYRGIEPSRNLSRMAIRHSNCISMYNARPQSKSGIGLSHNSSTCLQLQGRRSIPWPKQYVCIELGSCKLFQCKYGTRSRNPDYIPIHELKSYKEVWDWGCGHRVEA